MSNSETHLDFEGEEDWLEAGLGAVESDVMLYDAREPGLMVDYAEVCLLKEDVDVFQSGGRLVHPIRLGKADPDDAKLRRPRGQLMIRNVAEYRLREYLSEVCHFYKKKGDKDPERIPVPMELVKHMVAREGHWKLRELTGIVETPTLRTDGSLLQAEGYDEASGLLADFNGIRFPTIKDNPIKDDALRALATLKKLIADFPFVATTKGDSPSRAVALSAILTGLVRRSLKTAPLHAASAPTPGTGKTLLFNTAGMIATGRPVAAISNPRNEDEEQKQLLTLLAEGAPIILIDNVDRPLGSDVLCTVLSEESWTKRILGVSQSVTVFTNALMMTTGNNLVFEGDITRRVIMAKLDAGMEHPEKRKFEIDLKAHVLRKRPQLVHAGLTILRAHIAAGYPGKADLEPFGSFEQWSDTVRAALVWLGESDPVRTRKFIEADDPQREAATKLFRAIWDDRGEEWFKASELCSETVKMCSDDTLARAVEGVIPPRVTSEERALGRYLKQQQGRIYDGLRLCPGEDKRAKVFIYRIVKV